MVEVKDIELENVDSFYKLLQAYQDMGGFTAERLGQASDI